MLLGEFVSPGSVGRDVKGAFVGTDDGCPVGVVGWLLGWPEGVPVGWLDGCPEGCPDGLLIVGLPVG